ncbi:exopolyphosphatase [Halalkalibacter hemicellulosilyticus]|uniref:Exopolyphosphatase n=1 Tax=Halalkalibacter hemicellulosilyticusJCM 9152 TaxID=1236971 RepID=W4QGC3_9BACI|nr:exopolyphosphatase [Halalkalibacter hemicellulosilyticus]GAE30703.1 exopolyphosphatase [Halalkalibacter hemicellulosilyticusJCM 9152]
MSTLFAIVDMGSNSIRLVINEIEKNGRYKELYNFKTVARLSSHLDDQGVLLENGIQLILDTLSRFQTILNAHNIKNVQIIATAAMRKAENKQDIIKLIKKKLNLDIQILSEYEEAFYGYLAVVNSMSIETGLTIDIGGGSTEITYFNNRKLIHYHSFPFGAVTLQKQFFSSDQSQSKQIQLLRKFILNELKTLSWLKKLTVQSVIGIGGSARNISLIHQRQSQYPLTGIHQYEYPTSDLMQMNQQLQRTNYVERLTIDGLSKDRADIIIPAAEVIASIVHYVKAETFIMSRKGLRDGVFYEELLRKMETTFFPNVAEESFFQLAQSYEIPLDQANQIHFIAKKLYEQLSPLIVKHNEDETLRILRYGANVFYMGKYINQEASSQNTFYLLTNMTIDGLSHQERLAIALLASFKSKSQLQTYAKPFKKLLSKMDMKLYETLGAILKIAYVLNCSHQKAIIDIGKIKKGKTSYVIPIFYKNDPYFEQFYADKNIKHLEKALKQSFVLHFQEATVLSR